MFYSNINIIYKVYYTFTTQVEMHSENIRKDILGYGLGLDWDGGLFLGIPTSIGRGFFWCGRHDAYIAGRLRSGENDIPCNNDRSLDGDIFLLVINFAKKVSFENVHEL